MGPFYFSCEDLLTKYAKDYYHLLALRSSTPFFILHTSLLLYLNDHNLAVFLPLTTSLVFVLKSSISWNVNEKFHVANIDMVQLLIQSTHIIYLKKLHKSKSSSPPVEFTRNEHLFHPYLPLKDLDHIIPHNLLESLNFFL